MIYVRKNILSKLLTKHVPLSDIEWIFLELNFRKCKQLLVGTYHPPSQNDHYFFENLDKKIDVCSHYEKILLADLETLMQKSRNFVQTLFFTNMSLRIQSKKKHVLKTFRILVALIFSWQILLYLFISNSKPREIHYRDCKKFDSLKFKVDLKNAFAHEKIHALNLTRYL